MFDVSFDPTGEVTFDLATGRVAVGEAAPRVVVPAEALSSLAAAAGPEASRAFGTALGQSMGTRIAARLGGTGAAAATLEAFAQHLSAELALAGLGAPAIERWGRALVLVVEHVTVRGAVLEGVLEGTLSAAMGREVGCTTIMAVDDKLRLLVSGRPTAKRVMQWMSEGDTWREVLVRLHDEPHSRGEA